MKDFTIAPLGNYKWKIIGVVTSILSIILIVLTNELDGFILINKYSKDQHLQFFYWLTIYGFVMIVFSKEKNEDERVQKIRGKSFQIAFQFLISTMMGIGFVNIYRPTPFYLNYLDLGLIGLIPYLLFFHIALYFDPQWTYNEGTALDNIRKNKTFFFIYILLAIILIAQKFIFKH